jgi:hypothetical protein
MRMEGRLERTGRAEEFNKQFQSLNALQQKSSEHIRDPSTTSAW